MEKPNWTSNNNNKMNVEELMTEYLSACFLMVRRKGRGEVGIREGRDMRSCRVGGQTHRLAKHSK